MVLRRIRYLIKEDIFKVEGEYDYTIILLNTLEVI